MSKKITHKYFDKDYWMTPHTKSGYSPQEGYNRGEYAPKATADFLTQLYGLEGKWLEAGCAFGWVVEQLRVFGVHAIGFDISKYAIKNGCDYQVLRQSDGLKDALYTKSQFDLIYSIETAEHIHQDNIGIWLGNLHEWIRPGGKLFMTICVGNNNLRGLDDIDLSHQTLQPRSWWEDWLSNVGFVIDKESYDKALSVTLEHDNFDKPFNAKEYFQWHIFTWKKPQ